MMPEPAAVNGQRMPAGGEGRRDSRPPASTAIAQASVPVSATSKRPTEELEVLIRARYPIIYVVTWEEERLEQRLLEIAKRRNKTLHVWTCSQGVVPYGAEPQRGKTGSGSTCDPIAGLDAVLAHVDPAIFLFKDLHDHLDIRVCPGNLRNIRRLRDVAHALRDTYKTVVLVSPVMKIPVELSKDVAVVEFGTPSVDDVNRLLDRIINDVKDQPRITINLDAEGREKLVHAARGLTLKEAENVFAKTLVLDGKLDADDIRVVFSEKQQIIRKSGILEYYESQEQFATVAGLDNLKDWLNKRSAAFSERAAQFGLPAPKGVLLLGVQGCGKSLCAKAASSLWKLPLLRFDIGRVFGSLVGSSEESMRRAIQTAESVAPAILWIDEIDKAFAGTQGSSGSDGGTASRVFSTFLTWLSEKSAPVFVIATANDISHLPPELLRKGRVDEIFFVDLPNEDERREIFRIHITKRKRDSAKFDLDALARMSDGFSGAEIEEAIISGLFDAFSHGAELDTATLRAGIAETVPLSRTMSEELARLRTWAQGRARPATGALQQPEPSEIRRKLEI
jgi:ATPase family associated with various cellular activities (AAA)